MGGDGGCSSYLADPTSPIPSHCASIVVTSTVRVNFILDSMIQIYLQATGYCWFKPFAWCFRWSFSDPKPRARNSVDPVTAVPLWSLCHAFECCFVDITCMYTHINTRTLWLSDIRVHYVTVSGHSGHRRLILSDKRSLLVCSDQWFYFLTRSCTVSHSDMQLYIPTGQC